MEIYKAEHELHSTQGPAAPLLVLEKLGRVESMVEAQFVATLKPLGGFSPNQSHRLVDGGIFLCDDYGFDSCPRATRAVDEFLRDKPEKAISLSDGGGFFIKGCTTG